MSIFGRKPRRNNYEAIWFRIHFIYFVFNSFKCFSTECHTEEFDLRQHGLHWWAHLIIATCPSIVHQAHRFVCHKVSNLKSDHLVRTRGRTFPHPVPEAKLGIGFYLVEELCRIFREASAIKNNVHLIIVFVTAIFDLDAKGRNERLEADKIWMAQLNLPFLGNDSPEFICEKTDTYSMKELSTAFQDLQHLFAVSNPALL